MKIHTSNAMIGAVYDDPAFTAATRTGSSWNYGAP